MVAVVSSHGPMMESTPRRSLIPGNASFMDSSMVSSQTITQFVAIVNITLFVKTIEPKQHNNSKDFLSFNASEIIVIDKVKIIDK